jgi:hypothetical protein
MDTQIARPIEVVRGYKVMSKRMGKPAEVVRDWASDGAPIYLDTGYAIAELAELWEWRKRKMKLVSET